MAKEIDDAAARELRLYIDNEEAYYKNKILIYKALAKKKDAGKYDHDKAPKAFASLLGTAAKSYTREHGSFGDKFDRVFPVITRKHAADDLAEHFLEWYRVDWKLYEKKAAATTKAPRRRS